jgi:hypothetical protein
LLELKVLLGDILNDEVDFAIVYRCNTLKGHET